MGKRKLKLQLREARACVNELLSQRNAQDARIREMAEELERYEDSDDEQINRLMEENRILRAQVAAHVSETFTSEEPQERDDVRAAITASEECKEMVKGLWKALKALSDAMVHKANAETVTRVLGEQKDRARAIENEVAGLNRKLLTEEDERAQVQKHIDRMNQEMAEMRRLLVEMDKGFTGRLDADRASIALVQSSIIDLDKTLADTVAAEEKIRDRLDGIAERILPLAEQTAKASVGLEIATEFREGLDSLRETVAQQSLVLTDLNERVKADERVVPRVA